ncbi:MAG: sigma 54-interacting transcriptional regulator [Sarcina sp.]
MYKQSIKISIASGIHTRFAAMIVSKAADIKAKYDITIYIKKEKFTEWLGISMLGLLALKINQGDTLSFGCKETSLIGKAAIQTLIDYIDTNINLSEIITPKIDAFIDESNIANENLLDELPVGIITIDTQGIITKINSYALHLIKKSLNEALGTSIRKLIPNTELLDTIIKKEKEMGKVLHLENKTTIVNRSPLFNNSEIIGAVAVIQDISDMVGIIDAAFSGVLSSSNSPSDLKELISKLEKSEEELNFYKEEFLKDVKSSSNNIIGFDTTLKDIMYISNKAAKSTSTVLIRGESGTGKELIAKFIHNESQRKNMPFVRVNCAAIPENLLESELFGYEKGSFTGALKAKPGKFEIANGGTIFLDEIGDMPISMQVKILRVLQEMEIERIGALAPQKINVRVIAATNRNLESMMNENKFRKDLFYRLNVLAINLPALKDRREDIKKLASYFIDKVNKKLLTSVNNITNEAIATLELYAFPGNIRELENIIERAINLCDTSTIKLSDLPSYISNTPNNHDSTFLELDSSNILTFEEYEKKIITAALKKYKSFNKTGKALGLTHRTISLKCKKYQIKL